MRKHNGTKEHVVRCPCQHHPSKSVSALFVMTIAATAATMLCLVPSTSSFQTSSFPVTPISSSRMQQREVLSPLVRATRNTPHHVRNNPATVSRGITTAPPLQRQQRLASSSLSMTMIPTAITNAINPLITTFASISSPLASIAVLAFVVLIHELGHFSAARSLGIAVQEFSVGVGPKIAGFTSHPSRSRSASSDAAKREQNAEDEEEENDDGIDFSLRVIPLGGYVRFPDNYNRTLAMEMEDEVRAKRKKRRQEGKQRKENKQSMTQTVHHEEEENRSWWDALKLGGQTGVGGASSKKMMTGAIASEKRSKEKRQQQQWWENIVPFTTKTKKQDGTITPEIINSVDDDDEDEFKLPKIEYYDNPNLLQNRPWFERAVVLSAGVVFNLLLAFSCYFGEMTIGNGLPKPVFEPGAVVSQVPRYDGPSNGILKRGDILVGINGERMSLGQHPTASASHQAISDFIAKIRETPLGESVTISVVRPKKPILAGMRSDGGPLLPPAATTSTSAPTTSSTAGFKYTISPGDVTDVTIKPKPIIDNSGNVGPQSIGVLLAPNYIRTDFIKATSIPDGVAKSTEAVSELVSETTSSLLGFLGSVVSGKGPSSGGGQQVSGPIGVIKAGSDIVRTNDLSAVIAFAAALSVNLAVVNSLPLPALDGGQLMFVFAEAIIGRKIDQRVEEGINAAALLMLLIFSFGTALGDVGLFGR